ncbi:Retron-type reverse transcriptase [Serratia fonticola]|uniref:Retron-type reverse transcriptase n=1 Tax=Serratia fonticola TaxID=47917 RepID=A0A4U9UAL5_SERFO|nr:Retron-type reverse transcriptase [Serratia fonticola]
MLLDDFDKELEKRGLKFVRYADDCNIYVKSERAGRRVMEGLTHWLSRKLKTEGEREEERGSAAGNA